MHQTKNLRREKILKTEPLKDCEELEDPFTSIPDLLRKT